MPYIRHLHYEEAGKGHPVILIHCPAVSRLLWRPLMARLRTACRPIAVDLRGHGQSGLGDIRWGFPDIAADLALLVQRLDLRPAPVLVGYSTGGSVALQAALDNPGLYSGLVLIGSFSECTTLHLRSKVQAGLMAARAGLTPLLGRAVVAANHATPEHGRLMLPEAQATRPQSLASLLQETLRANFTPRLGEIRQPALLVYGSRDELMHPYYRILRRGLANARSVFVPGCGHHVPTSHPTALADLLAQFVAGLEPPAADPLLLPTFHHPGVDLHPLDQHP
ncbi:MAG: alpha/beta fold hydrolase [Bacillota bacterium]